ncbi:MAG: cytochrome b N-terminal domain-containing protein [Myxococcaceae bacterium]
MLKSLFGWLDQRTGLGQVLGRIGEHPLPGGARWGRTFGTAAVVFLLLEALTGIGLGAWYSPSTTGAWASVNYVQTQLTLGWLLRGLHHVGGNALIVLVLLHLGQMMIWGAYRAPRELTWITGLLAVQVLLVVSHTGFLLPWDLRAYWATQVLVGIAGNQPGVGAIAQEIIQGGPTVGNATLTHLYAAHVLVMPGAVISLIALHIWLRAKHPAAYPPKLSDADAGEKAQSYFPHQLARDLAVSFAVLLGIVVYLVRQHGIELGAPADPAIEYVARPEWYFYPVFHLRHWFTGSMEFIATSALPGVAVMALCALPFIAKKLDAFSKRTDDLLKLLFAVGAVATVMLGVSTAAEDAADEKANKMNEAAAKAGFEAQRLAAIGVPVTGPLELYRNDPLVWGKRVFERECSPCHKPADTKNYDGSPILQGYASRAWLKRFLREPHGQYFFGNTKGIDEMDAYDGPEEKLDAIVEYLYAEGKRPDANAELAERGKGLYGEEGCDQCHTLDGVGNGDAPDLKGFASEEWLAAFIRQPSAPRFYGKLNEMDEFDAEKLSKDELQVVVAWLRERSNDHLTFGTQKTSP